MARGGYRPGAGRPKGTGKVTTIIAALEAPECDSGTPLEYMLGVMNDASADAARRDRMAIAAAPYVHERADNRPAGKKDEAREAAKTAGAGTEWGDDLAGPIARLN